MELSDFITPEAVVPALRATSKKQLLQILAEKAAILVNLPEQDVLDAILKREKLGSTALGNGIAIPHGMLTDLTAIFGVFARLEFPVDFEALDQQQVELVFLLLVPENAGANHLKILSSIARLMRNPDMVDKLRNAHGAQALYVLLTHRTESCAA